MRGFKKHGILFLIPIIYLALYFYFTAFYGPFFATRIDPEYPYLLNGLNCAQLLFGQIGHVHHPGTPFQIFIGFELRFIHLIFGKGPILEDVFARPEYYLTHCSQILAWLTTLVLVWAGYWARRVAGLPGMLFIQLTPFFSSVVLLMSVSRFTPDRFVIFLLIIMIGLVVRQFDAQKMPNAKFALLGGLLAGIALCTKISCLPVLLIPMVMARKYWWLFFVTTVAVFFLFMVPVSSRIPDFFAFTNKLASHDGLYGSGNEQMVHWGNVLKNIRRIVHFNPGFILILAMSLIVVVSRAVQRKWSVDLSLLFTFILASLASSFLVAKHFKNYYLASILIFSGLVLFLSFHVIKVKTSYSIAVTATGGLMVVVLGLSLNKLWQDHIKSRDRLKDVAAQVEAFAQLNLGAQKVLIDPSWEPAPFKEKGITFGISYIRHHNRYVPLINKMFSHVITYEGADRAMKKLRVVDFDQSEVFQQDDHLYFFDKSKKRTEEILADLRLRASTYSLSLQVDTLHQHSHGQILDINFIEVSADP